MASKTPTKAHSTSKSRSIGSAKSGAKSARSKPVGRRQQPVDAREGRKLLNASDWVEAATDVLVKQSVDAVRVETLAKQLGVTKGSFYWHFEDRPDLLRAIILNWRQRATAAVIERTQGSAAEPREKLRNLLALPQRSRQAVRAASIEVAIRAWARRDPNVRSAVDAVDRERLDFVAKIYREMGLPKAEADNRAYLAYALTIADSLLNAHDESPARDRRRRFAQKVVSGLFDARIGDASQGT